MSRPILLDLFCCAGGASMGYHRAGFEVVGVDMEAKHGRNYPFEFHQGDALAFVRDHGHEFDAIAASPPCQAYSITKHTHSKDHPDLLVPTREALVETAVPYVIENVAGAPLLNPLTLCGTEFGLVATDHDGTLLELRRHRLFESNVMLWGAGGCKHGYYSPHVAGAYGGAPHNREYARQIRKGGYVPRVDVRAVLLGIDWPMTEHQLNQSIPPAYTEHIGRQLIAHIEAVAA